MGLAVGLLAFLDNKITKIQEQSDSDKNCDITPFRKNKAIHFHFQIIRALYILMASIFAFIVLIKLTSILGMALCPVKSYKLSKMLQFSKKDSKSVKIMEETS